MKKIIALVCALMLVLSAASFALADDVPTLTISTWAANLDTITANVFTPFEEANNCKIIVDAGNNAARLGKLQENPDA